VKPPEVIVPLIIKSPVDVIEPFTVRSSLIVKLVKVAPLAFSSPSAVMLNAGPGSPQLASLTYQFSGNTPIANTRYFSAKALILVSIARP
jgi:hypothetical protein